MYTVDALSFARLLLHVQAFLLLILAVDCVLFLSNTIQHVYHAQFIVSATLNSQDECTFQRTRGEGTHLCLRSRRHIPQV